MLPSETLRLEQALRKLNAVYTGHSLSPDVLKIYAETLDDIPIEDALHACDLWLLKDTPFFPKPGQLRALAGARTTPQGLSDLLRTRALQAWHNLRNPETRYNAWALADPITQHVFQLMGGGYVLEWGFGNWDGIYEEHKRREFIQHYLDLATTWPELPPLPSESLGLLYLQSATRTALPAPAPALTEDFRVEVQRLIAELITALSAPADVPQRYLRVPAKGPIAPYQSPLSAEECLARREQLRHQVDALLRSHE